MNACPTCKREFATYSGLGQHRRHVRQAIAGGRRNRICPDRRSNDEAREAAMLRIRVKSKLGLIGKWP